MKTAKSYPNPPVIEAVFEIQVELPKNITISKLDSLSDDIKENYPKKKTRRRFQSSVEFKSDKAPTSQSLDLGIDGFLNWSNDEKQVVQFRLDGFSFSGLKPYLGWDHYLPEVIKNWDIYSKKISPIRIKRISIRFINLIEIPQKKFELSKYFINSPQVPFEAASLSNFLNRVELNFSESNVRAIITQKLALSNHPIKTPIVLDIEVSKEINASCDEKTILNVFDVLRGIKNDIFNKSITSATKELFL